MGDSAQEECSVCLADGSTLGPLGGALRPTASGDLHRRKTLCQLLKDVRDPLPMQAAGTLRRFDYEYQRGGICYVHVAFEPLTGWRGVMVSERRTKREFAQEVCQLAQELYPDAEKIRLVCDNLSTHSPAAFYEILAPEQARRLSRRVEFIYTPVDGSWLNMVEVEICRVGQTVSEGKAAWQHCEELRSEAEAWCWERNRLSASVDWRFTTSDARIKLRKLYPSIEH